LAAIAVVAYLNQSPAQPWLRLVAPAAWAALAAWRFGWGSEHSSAFARQVISLFGLAVLTCFVQSQFPSVDQPWAWLVVLPMVALFREPKLLWAILPAFAWTHVVVLSSYFGKNPDGVIWPMVWALVLAAADAVAVWLLRDRKEMAAVAFISSALLLKAWGVALGLPASPVPELARSAALWLGGVVSLAVLAEVYRRLKAHPAIPLFAQLAFLPSFMVLGFLWSWNEKSLALTPLWLVGLALALYALARHSAGLATIGTACRAFVCAGLGLVVFIHFSALPGAGVSLFWALAAALTFILGFLLQTRSFRMVGIVGLVIATGHVILFDVHDILGRIVACAAVAIAFFGVAWLYGKVVKKSAATDG
jgi:hypothetical protein